MVATVTARVSRTQVPSMPVIRPSRNAVGDVVAPAVWAAGLADAAEAVQVAEVAGNAGLRAGGREPVGVGVATGQCQAGECEHGPRGRELAGEAGGRGRHRGLRWVGVARRPGSAYVWRLDGMRIVRAGGTLDKVERTMDGMSGDGMTGRAGPGSDQVKPELRVVLAGPRGFCAGVDRAIRVVEEALRRYGKPVYVRHEIVHNRTVVEELEAQGAVFVEELDEVPADAHVVFSAHGVPKSVPAEAERRNLMYLDATCPLVSKVHREAERHFAGGGPEQRHILMIGHEGTRRW